jgi:AcrR family transcriptional regulator
VFGGRIGYDSVTEETMTAAEMRRARARQEMREQILDAAREAVMREGVAALSMRAIARGIGYSPAALYEYFPAKEDVLQALYFEGANGLAGRVRSTLAAMPPEATPGERFHAQGIAYREAALAQPELYQFAFSGTISGFTPNEANLNCGWEAFEILIDTAREGLEAGELIEADPTALAVAAWATVHGFVMLEIGGLLATRYESVARPLDRAERDRLYQFVLRGIALGLMRRD